MQIVICPAREFIYNVSKLRIHLLLELIITVQKLLFPRFSGIIGERAEDKEADPGFNLILVNHFAPFSFQLATNQCLLKGLVCLIKRHSFTITSFFKI
jgi:hypothetical protein